MEPERPTFDNIAAETTAEVCNVADFTNEARELFAPEAPPADFLEALIGAGLFPDAIRFLAYALPKADAVRWACSAAQRSGDEANDSERKCIESALEWIEDASEDNRRAAMEAAENDGYSGAAAWAAAAAGWSGGSMAPPDLDDVPPPEHLTATAVNSAILLASVAGEPDKVKETQSELLQAGMDLAAKPTS